MASFIVAKINYKIKNFLISSSKRNEFITLEAQVLHLQIYI